MTLKEIKAMAEETGLPCAYDHFAEGESPAPPFLIFRIPSADNFSADGLPYYKQDLLDFELYTDVKDPGAESKVEAVLEMHSLFYDKSEVWIPDESLYEVLYEMEV